MSRSAAAASSLLRRLAAASSRPPVPTRSISAVPAGPLCTFNAARAPRHLSPFFTSSRGFARGRRESVPREDDDDEQESDDDDDDDYIDDVAESGTEGFYSDDLPDYSHDGESVDERKDESD